MTHEAHSDNGARTDSSVVYDDLSEKLAGKKKQNLKKRNLKTSGPKNKLILRLVRVMQNKHEHGTVESSGRSEDGDLHDEDDDEEGTGEDINTIMTKRGRNENSNTDVLKKKTTRERR